MILLNDTTSDRDATINKSVKKYLMHKELMKERDSSLVTLFKLHDENPKDFDYLKKLIMEMNEIL